jgi:hypothetical protein
MLEHTGLKIKKEKWHLLAGALSQAPGVSERSSWLPFGRLPSPEGDALLADRLEAELGCDSGQPV